MQYTFKGNDPRAHAAAVQAKRLELRYGTSDARQAWQKTLATYRRSGRSEAEAIRLCMQEHRELATAYSTSRLVAPARPVAPAPSPIAQRWEAAIAERTARGLPRWQAILDIQKTDPALYAEYR